MKLWTNMAAALGLGLVLMGGCAQYSEEKVFNEQLPQTTETITAVVTRMGTQIAFDDRGGSYQTEFVLTGTTIQHQRITLRSTEIMEFRAESPQFVPLDEIPSYKVAEVLTDGDQLIMFAPPGGSIEKTAVSGFDQTTKPLSVLRKRCVGGRLNSPLALDQRMGVSDLPVREVVLNGTHALVRFDSSGIVRTGFREVVMGVTPLSTLAVVPLDSILYVKVKRTDAIKTIAASIGVVAVGAGLVVAIIAATKQSCPFLYSYDGNSHIFDAEPLGGATTAGLARTELSRMEHLRPIEGTYRVLLRNEVEETQYVDKLQLMYCDHDASVTPIADGSDAVVLFKNPLSPINVVDEDGTDLLPFFRSRDGIAWETHMLAYAGNAGDSTRHTLRFRFTKPAGASRATVILHGGTTLWGSTMIRVMYQLRGRAVDQWYREADQHGPAFYETMLWLAREDLYTMPLYARRGGEWVERGTVSGGGPLIHETQTLTFPLSRFTGDTLELCLRPPKGFWSFDEVTVTYDSVARVPLCPLLMTQAMDQNGRDVSALLEKEDREYYEMPTQLDQATIAWSAPPVPPSLQRTVFARTTGYYVLHLSKDGPEDIATLRKLLTTPGEIVRYSAQHYRAWRVALREHAHERLH